MTSIYDFTVVAANGESVSMDEFEGKVLLIVNVASRCGYTPQYEGLEALYRDEGARGLQLIGFPCDQFGHQEPGTDEEIQEFCTRNYGVTFPVMSKVDVNGPDADPMYAFLRAEAPGDFSEAPDRLASHIRKTRPEAIGTDISEIL